MKSILAYSMLLHAVAITATLEAVAHQRVIHASTANPVVMEVSLGAAPRIAHVSKGKSAGAEVPNKPTPQHQDELLHADPPAPTPVEPAPIPQETASVLASMSHSPSMQSALPAAIHRGQASTSGSSDAGTENASAKPGQLPWIVASTAPEYPRVARRNGWTGRVGVHVLISTTGSVQQVELASTSGHAELDRAALKALRKWIFHPAEKDGHATEAWVIVPVLFRLDD